MGVYINGMEMPEDGCHHIICIYANGTVVTGKREYRAISVPQHGRLIDADKLLKAEYNIDLFGSSYIRRREICNAPTIIQADECE